MKKGCCWEEIFSGRKISHIGRKDAYAINVFNNSTCVGDFFEGDNIPENIIGVLGQWLWI